MDASQQQSAWPEWSFCRGQSAELAGTGRSLCGQMKIFQCSCLARASMGRHAATGPIPRARAFTPPMPTWRGEGWAASSHSLRTMIDLELQV